MQSIGLRKHIDGIVKLPQVPVAESFVEVGLPVFLIKFQAFIEKLNGVLVPSQQI